jgi:alpha-amylase
MTTKKVNLVLGIHNHQPYGNFDDVIEHACERCYLPFLQVLERHPAVKFSVHFTGYLLEWINRRYPEIQRTLEHLVERGQVELVTGGYYEPILATIPDTDKVGQINKLTGYLKQLFNGKLEREITGMWLAERVWEPHLPKALAACGVKYVCLDDSHFKGVGMSDSDLFRSYVTEEQGHTLEIFPINQKLRYIIPFDQPESIINYLRSVATESGERGAFYFDDGEKFGVWPGTYNSVYKEKWLDNFFSAIENNLDWINPMTFGEYRNKVGPAGRVYLPTASYMEMLEWSLPADRATLLDEAIHTVDPRYATFLRGGFWRFFMVKYPEANNLHKKMLSVSKQLDQAASTGKHEPAALEPVRDKLWSGQSNDPYWHGVFGGLYLTNLRTANYQALVEAEAALDRLAHKDGEPHWLESEITDVDCDGLAEAIIKTPICNYYVAPAYGGALFELDYKPRPFNFIDTLARRPEAYHARLKEAKAQSESGQAETIHKSVTTKEADLEKYLVYDWHRRLCFLDHFLDPGTTLESMTRAQYGEKGDFVNQPFEIIAARTDANKHELTLERQGHVWVGERRMPVSVRKTYAANGASETLKVSYSLTNLSDERIDLWFAPELNFNFLAPEAADRYYFDPASGKRLSHPKLSSQAELAQADAVAIGDEWLGVRLIVTLSQTAAIWRYPVHTVSNSEAGFERVFQGSCLVPNWRITLDPRAAWSVEIELAARGL